MREPSRYSNSRRNASVNRGQFQNSKPSSPNAHGGSCCHWSIERDTPQAGHARSPGPLCLNHSSTASPQRSGGSNLDLHAEQMSSNPPCPLWNTVRLLTTANPLVQRRSKCGSVFPVALAYCGPGGCPASAPKTQSFVPATTISSATSHSSMRSPV